MPRRGPRARRYGSDTEGRADEAEPERPEFPPGRLALAPAFPAALGDALGAQLLEVWGFLRCFPEARPGRPLRPPARLAAQAPAAASSILCAVPRAYGRHGRRRESAPARAAHAPVLSQLPRAAQAHAPARSGPDPPCAALLSRQRVGPCIERMGLRARGGGSGAALDGGRLETRARAQVLGLAPVAFEALVGAVAAGGRSRLLGQIHIALLRLLLADMEEAHASGALQVPRPPSQCRPLAARSTTGAPRPAPHAGAGAARMRAGCGGRPLARGARPAPSAQRLTPRRWRLAACAPGARIGARLPASAARGALRRAASRARRTGTTLWTARWWRARPRWRRPGPGALTWTPGARTSTSCPGPRCAAPARGCPPARPPLPRRRAPHPPASWHAAHGVI